MKNNNNKTIEFEDTLKKIHENVCNTEGFDTEELMVAAFLAGAHFMAKEICETNGQFSTESFLLAVEAIIKDKYKEEME